MCIFLFNNKDKIMTNIFIFAHFGLNINLFYSFSRRFYPKWLKNEDIIEAIKTNKRATTYKFYYKSWLA